MSDCEAVLLGTAQDAGLPQAGCGCARCTRAHQQPLFSRFPVSLALVDHPARAYWLIDATPAVTAQLGLLQDRFPGYRFSGVLLTHAHSGHYTGLIAFGKEAGNLAALPLFASSRVLAFLDANEPWRTILRENLAPEEIRHGERISLTRRLAAIPVDVPHRAEYSDTLAFRIKGPEKGLFYCPDIDAWESFPIAEMLRSVDVALLDGTFWSAEEIPGRDIRTVPHPPVQAAAAQLAGVGAEVFFIHLNHTNPLHDPGSERRLLEARGLAVGEQGRSWRL